MLDPLHDHIKKVSMSLGKLTFLGLGERFLLECKSLLSYILAASIYPTELKILTLTYLS